MKLLGIDTTKKNAKVLNQFFETVSNFYIPLLNMFEKLETSNVYCKLGLVFSPVVCALLEDSTIHELYIDWLDKRCELGRKELERCKDKSEILHKRSKEPSDARAEYGCLSGARLDCGIFVQHVCAVCHVRLHRKRRSARRTCVSARSVF